MTRPASRRPSTTPWRDVPAVGPGLALALLVVIPYLGSLAGGFLWDDDLHVSANPTVIGPLGLKEIWTTSRANYFPLVLTSFRVQHALWGLNPVGYHAVSLGCHVLAALLLWQVLRQLRVPGAWLGAALWALHPVQVESVAWISELKNTQSAVFLLLAIWFWLRWIGASLDDDREISPVTSPRAWSSGAPTIRASAAYWLALVSAVLALLSKPSTVMLPVILALVSWWRAGGLRVATLFRLAPFFLLSALAAGWTIWEQKFHSGAIGPEWSQGWGERILIAGRALWFYAGKLIWPAGLNFIYPRWSITAGALPWIALLGAAAIAFAVWRLRCRSEVWRGAFVAGAWFVVLLFPVLGFFDVYFFRYSFVSDHFQYLASIGPLAAVAAGVVVLGRIGRVASVALLAAAAVLTAVQTGDYRNRETLWRHTVARNPGSAMAWAQLGAVRSEKGDHREAVACFDRALAINPAHPEALNHLGVEQLLAGRTADAVSSFERALRSRPAFPEAHSNLGTALLDAGRADDARKEFEAVAEAWPDVAAAHYNLAKALAALGQWDDALRTYAKVRQLRADYPALDNSIGVALMAAGRPAEAVAYYEAARRGHPEDPAIHSNLADALFAAGKGPEALGEYEQALRLEPARAETHDAFGLALASAGRTSEAAREFERAIELSAKFAPAYNHLGIALAQSGRMTEALHLFEEASQLQPNNIDVLLNRAGLLASLQRFSEAEAVLTNVVAMAPSSARAHAYLAQVLQALGRSGEAQQHERRAAELDASTAGR